MRIDSSQNVGIGTTSPNALLDVASNSAGRIHIRQSIADTSAPFLVLRKTRGSIGSEGQTLSGDELGGIAFQGHTGSAFSSTLCDIRAQAAENITASNEGASILFRTTPIGSTTQAERVIISSEGLVGIGETSPDELLHVGSGTKHDGFRRTSPTEAQTTTATPATLTTLTLVDETTYWIRAVVVGVKSDGSARAVYELRAAAYRTGAGSATLQGAVTSVFTQESDSSWDATMDVSGNDVRVRVTGAAATTIEWGVTLEYESMTN